MQYNSEVLVILLVFLIVIYKIKTNILLSVQYFMGGFFSNWKQKYILIMNDKIFG